jgi:hypothetical protein
MSDRKTPSLKAIDEMKDAMFQQCLKAHYKKETYHNSHVLVHQDQETESLEKAKEDLITKISKEVEEYAIKKYEKYGLISVPICRRKSSDGADRLNIALKIRTFIGLEKEIEAKRVADAAFRVDLQKIDQWHFDALSAIASRESLPKPPEFKPYGGA